MKQGLWVAFLLLMIVAQGCAESGQTVGSVSVEDVVNSSDVEELSPADPCEGVVCDDGNPCSDDWCDPPTGDCLVGWMEGRACDDGNACTVEDECDEVGACAPGSDLLCDDGIDCTADSCDMKSGCVFPAVEDGESCTDGNACTENDSCQEGQCLGTDKACADDENPCTSPEWCDVETGECMRENMFDGATCEDGNLCTTDDECSGGVCVGQDTSSIECNDGNVCTADSCVPETGCMNEANVLPCDDGNACTNGDTCGETLCIGGAEISCDDGDVCTADSCDPTLGCQNQNISASCNDDNACTVDMCDVTAGCVNLDMSASCNDNDACTVDVCDVTTGCVNLEIGASCDDDSACTEDSCDPEIGCINEDITASCEDNNPCTADTCDEVTGCANTLDPEICDDGNVCTTDSCVPETGCINEANVLPCDDGNACTKDDTCGETLCIGGADISCDDEDACTADSCDPTLGCQNQDISASCNDDNACTVDTCDVATGCVNQDVSANCDDGNACTEDNCDSEMGCINEDITASCDDSHPCTVDTCDEATGCANIPNSETCEDGNLCTDDVCSQDLGCSSTFNVLPCDDGDACTGGELCSSGSCEGGETLTCDDGDGCTLDSCDSDTGCINTDSGLDCDDGNPCTDDFCDGVAGCQYSNAPGGCDDGDFCTVSDFCQDGTCQNEGMNLCDDGISCTLDSCDIETQACVHTLDESVCDDSISCTNDACDLNQGGCTNTPDDSACTTEELCMTGSCEAETGCVSTMILECCGNGLTEEGEECDDGNAEETDGCSSACADVFMCPDDCVVDNTLTPSEVQKLTAVDGVAQDGFGGALSLSGDTLAVGAAQEEDGGIETGVVYVYTQSGTSWSQQEKVVPSDGGPGALFGSALSLSGDTLAVGAQNDDEEGFASGSVYVYTRIGTSWSQQQKIIASDASPSDLFGNALSLSGDTLAVGAWVDDEQGVNSGSVYIFAQEGGVWSLEQKLTASDGDSSDGFGYVVSLSGDTLAVGTPYDDGSGVNSGSVYVFTRSDGAWTQQEKITGSDGAGQDSFGWAVALSGNTLVVGAPNDDDGGSNSGSAYVYNGSDESWTQQQKLTGSGANGHFGTALTLSGDTLIVGAPDDGEELNSGSVYVYSESDEGWSQEEKITETASAEDDDFGSALTLSGDTLIVGVPNDDEMGTDSGSAMVYELSQYGETCTLENTCNCVGGFEGIDCGTPVCLGADASYCDDGIDCTTDACDEVLGCLSTPEDGACASGELCVTDTCDVLAGCASELTQNCCGNGLIEEGEACDDGNGADGDGCSSGCLYECENLTCEPSSSCTVATCSPELGCTDAVGGGECVAGVTETMSGDACGLCGVQALERTCNDSCSWGFWMEVACSSQGVCTPGQVQTSTGGTCANCGTATLERTCKSGCQWGEWIEISCEDEGECAPGTETTQSCGIGGSQTSTCTSSCTWSAFSQCNDPCACSPGTTETGTVDIPCQGNCGGSTESNYSCWYSPSTPETNPCCPGDCGCGTQCGVFNESRTCGGDCQWGDWNQGSLITGGVCEPGEIFWFVTGLHGTAEYADADICGRGNQTPPSTMNDSQLVITAPLPPNASPTGWYCGICGDQVKGRECDSNGCEGGQGSIFDYACIDQGQCWSGDVETQISGQSCGQCGVWEQQRSCQGNCAAGACVESAHEECLWGGWQNTQCVQEGGVCTPGAVDTQSCGNGGTQSRTCNGSCGWGAFGACSGACACSGFDTQTQTAGTCGNCGTQNQIRVCDGCNWGSWINSTCSGEGVCSPGSTDTQSCGLGGTQSQTCTSSCTWGGFGACDGQCACSGFEVQTQTAGTCGNCGTQNQVRVCDGCNFGSWTNSTCSGEGVCGVGATQSQPCGNGGTQSQTCTGSCTWGAFGACTGETGGGGECSPGQTTTECINLGPILGGSLTLVYGCEPDGTWGTVPIDSYSGCN